MRQLQILLKLIFILVTYNNVLFCQTLYPADSLLKSQNISLIKKMGILPISAFQRISYNSHFLNCQFYPSCSNCSNYGAHAIKEKGLILGSFAASDRILRCNPTAISYYPKYTDSTSIMLYDPLNINAIKSPAKSPAMAIMLSAVIPGTGRMYAGRWTEGFFGLARFALYASLTYYAYDEEMYFLTGLCGLGTFINYGGEIYGAFRSVKYYN